MKAITREWLALAADDLAAARLLLSHAELTNVVAFHAQQAVEKALKAAIEELDLGLVKTHSLARLYDMVKPHYTLVTEADMLDRLDSVYIEARYPGEMGLLPYGKPTTEDATDFHNFAQDVFERLQTELDKPDEDAGQDMPEA
jgi:HEPN domain-containing protein